MNIGTLRRLFSTFSRVQRVADSAFTAAASHILSGTGIGTSAVAGGLLQITSTTNVYFYRPLYGQGMILEAGTYSTTYTIGTYVSGSIAIVGADDAAFSLNLVSGTTRSANGTYTETITLARAGYIGLGGKGASIVNSLQISNFTITRVS